MVKDGPRNGWPDAFDKPKIFPERMAQAERWSDLTGTKRDDKPWIPASMPRLTFLCDMGDVFTEGLPLDWLDPFLSRMAASSS